MDIVWFDIHYVIIGPGKMIYDFSCKEWIEVTRRTEKLVVTSPPPDYLMGHYNNYFIENVTKVDPPPLGVGFLQIHERRKLFSQELKLMQRLSATAMGGKEVVMNFNF